MIKEENMKKNRLPIEIKKQIKEKHRARKRAQSTLHPEDKRTANRLNLEVKEKLQNYSNEQWQQKIEQLSTENGDIMEDDESTQERQNKNTIFTRIEWNDIHR
ncbi:hypothetical protein WA026_004263 [Henosepilachna vigintioctopunctata]|uniref:Uncharacterized protein n=1 Tax=Henosepilachna vigintioctopunctata TaxID=420089 RepID=A0AAW1V0X2_9CUCU